MKILTLFLYSATVPSLIQSECISFREEATSYWHEEQKINNATWYSTRRKCKLRSESNTALAIIDIDWPIFETLYFHKLISYLIH